MSWPVKRRASMRVPTRRRDVNHPPDIRRLEALIGSATCLNQTGRAYTGATSKYNDSSNAIVGAGVAAQRRVFLTPSMSSLTYDLINGQRTNLLSAGASETFARWTATSVTVTDAAATGPNGETNAATVQDTSAVANGNILQTLVVANDSLQHTMSIHVLKTTADTTYSCLSLIYSAGTGTTTYIILNTNTGSVSAQSGSPDGSGVADAGRYWRFWITKANNGTGNTSLQCRFYPTINTNGSTTFDVTATGTKTATAAMVEKANFPGSYVSNRNLMLQSENLGTSWTATRSSVTTQTAAEPLTGNVTADTVTEDATAANSHNVNQNFVKAASPLTFTASAYFKNSVGSRNALLQIDDNTGSNGVRVIYDFTGAVVTAAVAFGTGFSAPASTIAALANGWYRITITGTTNSAVGVRMVCGLASGSNVTYNGDSTSALFVWGSQLEYGTAATTYWATTTTIGLRAADVLTASLASTPGGGLGTVSGTLLGIYMPIGWSGDQDGAATYRVAVDATNVLGLIGRGTATTLTIRRDDAAGVESTGPTVASVNGAITQIAAVWDATSVRAFVNGVAGGTPDTTLTPPYVTCTSVNVGHSGGGSQLYGWLCLLYFPRALSVDETKIIASWLGTSATGYRNFRNGALAA